MPKEDDIEIDRGLHDRVYKIAGIDENTKMQIKISSVDLYT